MVPVPRGGGLVTWIASTVGFVAWLSFVAGSVVPIPFGWALGGTLVALISRCDVMKRLIFRRESQVLLDLAALLCSASARLGVDTKYLLQVRH